MNGEQAVLVPGHVVAYRGGTATWLSDPAGSRRVLSTGRSRAFLKTLLPAKAPLVKRGGDGHQLWGHPHEPTAQYNHVGARSLSPPIVPRRVEVEGPGGQARDYFLHVLEIGEEGDSAMSRAERVQAQGQAGVSLDAAGTPVVIRFSTQGPMSASLKIGNAPEERLGP